MSLDSLLGTFALVAVAVLWLANAALGWSLVFARDRLLARAERDPQRVRE